MQMLAFALAEWALVFGLRYVHMSGKKPPIKALILFGWCAGLAAVCIGQIVVFRSITGIRLSVFANAFFLEMSLLQHVVAVFLLVIIWIEHRRARAFYQ